MNTALARGPLSIALGVAFLLSAGSVFAVPLPPGGGGDGGAPDFSAPLAINGAVESSQISATTTAVRLNVSVSSDAVFEDGSIQAYVSLNGTDNFTIGDPYTISADELDTAFDLPDIAIADVYAALSIADLIDGSSLTFRQITTDGDGVEHDIVALGQLEMIVYVSDTVAPEIAQHATTTAEATGSSGATVSFTVTATDDVDGSVTPNCSPASGSTFALGTTTVTCNVSDAAGNDATPMLFPVVVRDMTAPVIAAHDTEYATSTSAAGAAVTYAAPTATDTVDASVTVSCLPASGATFAVGDATVTCNASDDTGNATSTTFTVRVAGDPVLATPASGSYVSAQNVVLSQSGATEIRYATGDSAPTCASGSVYSGAIDVPESVTIQALACFSGIGSIVSTFSYSINIPAPVQTPAPSGGGGNGPPVANPVPAPAPAPVSSGGGSASATISGGGTAGVTTSVAPPGTANGTPIVETPAPAPARAAAPASTNAPEPASEPAPTLETAPVPELASPVLTTRTNVQSAPRAQVATVESGLPGGNYLWILFMLVALLFGGWFVWNTFWTRAY